MTATMIALIPLGGLFLGLAIFAYGINKQRSEVSE